MKNVLEGKKLELQYPCLWEYKLISFSHNDVLVAVNECVKKEYKLKPSKTSAKGKYESFTLELLVHNEDERVELFQILKSHQNIKMVL
jgi:putative lipoic acid-binding regulatory protein